MLQRRVGEERLEKRARRDALEKRVLEKYWSVVEKCFRQVFVFSKEYGKSAVEKCWRKVLYI